MQMIVKKGMKYLFIFKKMEEDGRAVLCPIPLAITTKIPGHSV